MDWLLGHDYSIYLGASNGPTRGNNLMDALLTQLLNMPIGGEQYGHNFRILRVPGGWVYMFDATEPDMGGIYVSSSTFVPETEEMTVGRPQSGL